MSVSLQEALLASPASDLSKRQRRILDRVRSHGFVTIETLAEEFDTSTQTVRRDLIRLSELGLLQRFHGGAGMADGVARAPTVAAANVAIEDKARVGAQAASLIENGRTVFLDVGTTAQAVAESLREHTGLRVVTNSLQVAGKLAGCDRMSVHVLGGELRGSDGSLVGSSTVEALGALRVDVAVIGCGGFDRDGAAMDFDAEKVAVKRVAVRNAELSILAVDASKFTRGALMRVLPSGGFNVLVCSAPPPPRLADAFAASSTKVLVA